MVCSWLKSVRRLVIAALFLAFFLASHATAFAQTLPLPWQSTDVGSPTPAGSATWSSGTFSINGGGPDIGGNADAFTFAYQSLTGDGEIVCRVDSLTRTSVWAKAGLMIRADLTAVAKNVALVATPTKGLVLLSRTTAGGSTVQAATASGLLPRWLKLARAGQTISAYASPDGATWTPVGTQTITLGSTVDIGLAVTSRTTRALTTAAFSSVTVTAATTPANQPPTVSLTSPKAGTTYTAPAAIVLQATASDPDGTIARVDFYSNSALIGSATTSPYSFTWGSVPAGSYSLTAVARDNLGASQTSAAVSVTVGSNQPPTVSLTSPTANATFTAPATITLTASASDPDGSIARVDFYNGSALVGSASASPYTASWTNVASGTYSLTAVAFDNNGARTTSSAVSITVNIAPVTVALSKVQYTPSVDDAIVTSYTVEFFPASADPSTSAPLSSSNIGKPAPVNGTATADVSSMIQALPPGTYFATVSSNGTGGSSRSAPSATFVR